MTLWPISDEVTVQIMSDLGVGEQRNSYGTRSITVPLLPNTQLTRCAFSSLFSLAREPYHIPRRGLVQLFLWKVQEYGKSAARRQ